MADSSPRNRSSQSPTPRIVIAPDAFKGSCDSPQVAAAIARGVHAALTGHPSREGEAPSPTVIEIPLADGGEGTLDALVAAWGGRILTVPTTDALGRTRDARIGLSTDASPVAIIEAAEANGLPQVSDQPLQALDADSAGVGTLVRAALDAGASEILFAVGGSATNDGGAGMLRELGAQLLDAQGAPIAEGARDLQHLDRVELAGLDPRLAHTRWRVICDVDAPLTGPTGAAAVFGPQKGASPDDVRVIDAGLARLAEALKIAADTQGLGAAGGMPVGPVALWGAELVPGAMLVAEAAGLRQAVAEADLVITGEGRLDSQSLTGKVVSQVRADTPDHVPVIVIAGSVDLPPAACRAAGITAAFSIAPGPATLDTLQHDAERLLEATAASVTSTWWGF